MARRSRLSKNFQKRSRNTLILSILAIIVILFLLFKYGIPLISDASFFFGKVTSTPETIDEENSEIFIPVPKLYSLPNATSSETIQIKGTSLSDLTIEIFLNGERAGQTDTDESGEFTYKLTLTEGDNIIKVRAIKENSEGEFSSSKTIKYSIGGPDLSIESPADESDIKGGNPIEVKGSTDPDSTVTVNGFQAIINSEGNWTYRLTLTDGGNDILVASTDAAGNETEKTIHVNYSQ